jgi:hypothetical protein
LSSNEPAAQHFVIDAHVMSLEQFFRRERGTKISVVIAIEFQCMRKELRVGWIIARASTPPRGNATCAFEPVSSPQTLELPHRDLKLPGDLGLGKFAGLKTLQGNQAGEFSLGHAEKLHFGGFRPRGLLY